MIKTLNGSAAWGLLGAIVAVAAIESAIARQDLVLTPSWFFDYRVARAASTREAVRSDVLCLGTSMVQQGVFPAVIERRTALRTYNLAVCASRVPYMYYWLRQALSAGAKPSAVLADFHPSFITTPYTKDAECWVDGLSVGDSLDMAWTLRDLELFSWINLKRSIPSLYHRHRIRESIVTRLCGGDHSQWLANLVHIRGLKRNRGAFVGARQSNYNGEISRTYRMQLLPEYDGPCDPVERMYIGKILGLAREHGIRVYWLVLPLAPALHEERENMGLNASYTRLVNTFRDYSNLVVLDGRSSCYDKSAFVDASHLSFKGAQAFSNDVADVISQDRGLQWVNLPTYRDVPDIAPMETAMESQLALFPTEKTKR